MCTAVTLVSDFLKVWDIRTEVTGLKTGLTSYKNKNNCKIKVKSVDLITVIFNKIFKFLSQRTWLPHKTLYNFQFDRMTEYGIFNAILPTQINFMTCNRFYRHSSVRTVSKSSLYLYTLCPYFVLMFIILTHRSG